MTRPAPTQQPAAPPSLTWAWEQGRCYILVGGKVVTDGATMEEALQALGEQLRRAEREQERAA